jgi:BirA family transcriptional regulator, biotin operon repressor / biotin---[acetyl-CoA-carboxylase] ligase
MKGNELSAALAGLPLGGLRFFPTIGSTNDEALAWAASGAPDASLVVADEQTAGRGRSGRKWHTPPGAALALSLIFRPTAFERSAPGRFTGLAALAVAQHCQTLGLAAEVKWPNDVLLNGRKVAGILVESVWAGDALDAAVLGLGVNVATAALPPLDTLAFPATSLEAELGKIPDRLTLLRDILASMLEWRQRIVSPDFMNAWENSLAFKGQTVTIARDGDQPLVGTLLGLESDGSLRIRTGERLGIVHFGEIHLRPMDDRIG